MQRPDLKGCKKEVIEYIDEMESKLEKYNQNGAIELGAALNNKLNTIAEQIWSSDVNFNSKDDKLFDRFLKTITTYKDVLSDMRQFMIDYGHEVKEIEIKRGNLAETHFKNKNGKAENT